MLLSTAISALFLLTILACSSLLLRRREVAFELIPNQLLTRKPIVFLSGDRSIFYFTRYWNQIPSFLTEHGFEVYKAPLPWKKGPARATHLRKILVSWEEQNFSCHLFADPSLFQEISQVIAGNRNKALVSLNLVCADQDTHEGQLPNSLKGLPIAWREVRWTPNSLPRPLFWRAHRMLTGTPSTPQQLGLPLDEPLKHAFLEHLKVLAERDFTMPN